MYKYTAPSTVLLALRQRFRVGGSIRVKGSRMGTRFPTLPYPYSEHAYRSSESVRNNGIHTYRVHKTKKFFVHSPLVFSSKTEVSSFLLCMYVPCLCPHSPVCSHSAFPCAYIPTPYT